MHQLKREEPLYEQIYQSLEEAILAGTVAPGERLIDTKIALDFGVSRSPVREAFRKLESDGLLINKEGIVTVFAPSLQDVLELYQVRIGLESVAAFWATHYITREELGQLSQLLNQTEQAIEQKNIKKIIVLNTQFHESIISLSRNNRLKTMMYNIRSLIRLCRNTIIEQYNRGDNFLQEHYGIVRAMSLKDPALAAKEMEAHILHDMNYFKEFYLNHGFQKANSNLANTNTRRKENEYNR
ncbi:GntR family transcriptional regulator [Aneurinibacillus danicus]|uniref:GntR family transcriptional regulator n=1 Tax=Aneurinibacillus danicus TaxID=267746 RepID=A0A511V741_9BACL|nr:GntR family transcriptional regulator [Aneurinibacillus danicus]GEN33951.1 GntR family transcriptional regulator [Aneurinibacillus danicus]